MAILLTVAACGDDTTAKGTAQRDDVIAAANAICAQDAADDRASSDDYRARFASSDPSAGDARDFLVNTVAPRYDAVAATLHQIPKPLKDGGKWLQGLDALDARLKDFKYQIDQDPVALAKSVGKIDGKAATPTGALFVDFGATGCAAL